MPLKIKNKRSNIGLAVTAMAFTLMAGRASAGDANGDFAPKGIGMMPCSQFVQAAEEGRVEAAIAMSWFAGYLSASNMLLPETYDLVTWQEGILPSIVVSICQQAPDQPIAIAGPELINAFGPSRLQTAERPAQVSVGEKTRLLYPSTVRKLQEALQRAGQTVSVDGDFGPGTQSAISSFQTAMGIPPSGFPDEPTLVALLSGPAPAPQQAAPAQPAPAATPPALLPPIDMEPIQSPLSGPGQ
ncbi:MAG: peptidoglycan-binding protein [Pseudomonadota bacterium]